MAEGYSDISKTAERGGDQGPTVNNSNMHNDGGVVTGNNYGYNIITGTLNITVESADNLTTHLREFTAKVATAKERLNFVQIRVGATSSILSNIKRLVIIQAKKDGITITADKTWNDLTEDERNRIKGDHNKGDEDPEILKIQCFKDLIEASKGTRRHFDGINQRILNATARICPERAPDDQNYEKLREKYVLTDEERKQLSLSEHDIDVMESWIESYRSEIHINFVTFQAVLNHNKTEIVKRTMLDMYKDLRALVNYLLGFAQNPSNTGNTPPGILYPSLYPPQSFPDRRPLIFPDLSRLTALYVGWIFRKGEPSNSQSGSRSSKPSWKFAIPIQMEYSTEELFLKVLAQIAKRAKLNRKLRDDYKGLLKSRTQRKLVENLLGNQNLLLQKDHPQLRWKLAGLECSIQKRSKFVEEVRRIKVILKTEWVPGSRPNVPLGNIEGLLYGGIAAGSERGGYTVGGSIEINSRSRGSGNVSVERGRGYVTGGNMSGIPYVEEHTNQEFRGPYPQERSGRARHRPPILVREPKLVFIKEGEKAKTKRKSTNDGRRYLGKDSRGSHIYIELRQPGNYRRSRSRDSSSSLAPSPRFNLYTPLIQTAPFIRPRRSEMPLTLDHQYVRVEQGSKEMTPQEEKEVVYKLFAEWEELNDRKGKKKGKINPTSSFGTRNYDLGIGISRRLMREIELIY